MNIISCWENLKLRKLWDCQMREIGFQDITDKRWLYFKNNQSEALSFIIVMNKNDFKINKMKLIDRETKKVYSIADINKTSYKDNEEVLRFLKEIYIDFYNNGLIKEVNNESV